MPPQVPGGHIRGLGLSSISSPPSAPRKSPAPAVAGYSGARRISCRWYHSSVAAS
ncbi:hypothetical protein AZA_70432 [Nitrospirillum viridazoti Y2]|nr:hypothetical protein AZA_70432 [Nitrospirillum amazonense Y2]